MTNSQFNDEFVRQFTTNEAITPFTRYKHTTLALLAYAGSDLFWDLPEKEKVIACKVFQDSLYANYLLMKKDAILHSEEK